MFGFKTHQRDSGILLFFCLIGFALVASRYHLTYIFGTTFTFTSIFIFLLFRLYGLRTAVITSLLTLLLVPYDQMNIALRLVQTAELLFVSIFFYKGRKAKMFYVDGLFWFTLGLGALFLINRPSLSGHALYFENWKDIINGLFNVLIADMLLAYVPFYKLLKNRINKNHVSIHQFLSHITFISILFPLIIVLAATTLDTYNMVRTDIIKQANRTAENMMKSMKLWSQGDLNKLSEYGDPQLKKIEELVNQKKSNQFNIILIDSGNRVIASNTSTIPSLTNYDWQKNYSVEKIAAGFYQALPKGYASHLPIKNWGAGDYFYVKSIEGVPAKIIIQYPMTQFQDQIYDHFISQLKYWILFALAVIILVQVVSRIFIRNVKQLTIVTTGLPQKLITLETVEWPQSNVAELRLLGQNLMMMADKLKDLFRDSMEMNKKLKEQTNKLKESEDQLHQLAFYDVLTGLPNRRYFQNYANHLIEHENTNFIGIIFIDINQFKQINDMFGHDYGDCLLQHTAKRLSHLKSDHREVFRLGGDEFVMVDCAADKAEVSKTVDQILKEFAAPLSIKGQSFYVTASVGVSMFPEDGKNLDYLVKSADIAMYTSKERGGNVAQFFNESMRNQFSERLLIENALRSAVDQGGFELFYQPKTQGNHVTSMEALLRWNDPFLGSVSPTTFIPIAEKIGLILPIDEWSLTQACKQNKQWQTEGMPRIPISVNLSANHFQQDYLVSLIENTLNESGLDPHYLKLEITESVFIKNPNHVAEIIAQLKNLGVLLSIDDFGKEYSPLYQLLELPVDEIKIDRQFIQEVHKNNKKAILVKSILDLAHSLQLNVVAEGVEAEKERIVLTELGCDEIQGFLFSPPINQAEMGNILREETWSLALTKSEGRGE